MKLANEGARMFAVIVKKKFELLTQSHLIDILTLEEPFLSDPREGSVEFQLTQDEKWP